MSARSEEFYHGTDQDLMPGDIIEPGEDGLAWAAREPWYAARRSTAKLAENRVDRETSEAVGETIFKSKAHPSNYPRIYKVEPLDEPSDFHIDGRHLVKPEIGEGKHVTSKTGFMVTGEHTPDEGEWDDYINTGFDRYRESEGMPKSGPFPKATKSVTNWVMRDHTPEETAKQSERVGENLLRKEQFANTQKDLLRQERQSRDTQVSKEQAG